MKKLFTKVSIVLLLLIFLLCGCGDRAHYEDTSSPNETAAPVIPSLQTTPQPEISPTPVPEPEPKPSILDRAERIGDNLLLIPNELTESAVQQQIAGLGDNILAWSYRWNGQESELLLSLISREDGSTLAQRSFTGLEQANVQVCGEKVCIGDWADGRIFILDAELGDQAQYELGQQGAFYLGSFTDTAFVFESGRGIKAISLYGTWEDEYLLENVSSLYPSGSDGQTVGFSCISGENDMSQCGVLDLLTGETQLCPFDGMFYGIEKSGNIWLGSPFGESRLYYVGADKYPRQFTLAEMSFAELLPDGRILVKSIDPEGGLGLSLYSSEGIFISSCIIDMAAGGINSEPLWFEDKGGYFLDITTSEGSDRLLFWDVSEPETGQDLKLEPLMSETPTGSSVSSYLYEMAAELGEDFGLEIKIAELCQTRFGEFSGAQVYDEEYINNALTAVVYALRRLPDGFFDELTYSVFSETEIQLVGPLTADEDSSDGINFTGFVGAAVQEGTRNIIALDILRPIESVEQTLYHELSHLIEMRLEFDAVNKGGSFSEECWDALNPEGFEYYESRIGIPESVLYDGYEGWFIDVYSRVSASEDRARLFEYAMMGWDWAFGSSPGRTAKLDYYWQCIYETFGHEGWEEGPNGRVA